VLDALLMALWRPRPKPVMVHSDQGCQFTGHDWQDFLREHNLVSSMSRRGNCHDNAVAESFFQLLKRERIRRQIYATADDARKADVFNYIEMFYNPKRRHGTAGDTISGRVRKTPFPTAQKCLGNPGRFRIRPRYSRKSGR
jgi:putative transposase